ncbi:MAG: zinc-ribbon domain-containing protein [Deltaproteobacteria bacterium]|nr:zinc-ribbon domain-containing protein [Deltaproteobacteria bacterium]
MIVQCEKCRTKFRIPDEKVTEKGVKVRCSRCAHVFLVARASAGDLNTNGNANAAVGSMPPSDAPVGASLQAGALRAMPSAPPRSDPFSDPFSAPTDPAFSRAPAPPTFRADAPAFGGALARDLMAGPSDAEFNLGGGTPLPSLFGGGVGAGGGALGREGAGLGGGTPLPSLFGGSGSHLGTGSGAGTPLPSSSTPLPSVFGGRSHAEGGTPLPSIFGGHGSLPPVSAPTPHRALDGEEAGALSSPFGLDFGSLETERSLDGVDLNHVDAGDPFGGDIFNGSSTAQAGSSDAARRGARSGAASLPSFPLGQSKPPERASRPPPWASSASVPPFEVAVVPSSSPPPSSSSPAPASGAAASASEPSVRPPSEPASISLLSSSSSALSPPPPHVGASSGPNGTSVSSHAPFSSKDEDEESGRFGGFDSTDLSPPADAFSDAPVFSSPGAARARGFDDDPFNGVRAGSSALDDVLGHSTGPSPGVSGDLPGLLQPSDLGDDPFAMLNTAVDGHGHASASEAMRSALGAGPPGPPLGAEPSGGVNLFSIDVPSFAEEQPLESRSFSESRRSSSSRAARRPATTSSPSRELRPVHREARVRTWPTWIGGLVGLAAAIALLPGVPELLGLSAGTTALFSGPTLRLPDGLPSVRARAVRVTSYPNRAGQELLVVTGEAENTSELRLAGIQAVALVLDGDRVVEQRPSWLGVRLPVDVLASIRTPDDVDSAFEAASKGWASKSQMSTLEPGGRLAFMVVFPSLPEDVDTRRYQVEFLKGDERGGGAETADAASATAAEAEAKDAAESAPKRKLRRRAKPKSGSNPNVPPKPSN